MVYVELKYSRDRSSFAGLGLKLTDKPNQFNSQSDMEETEVQEINKYDKIRVGMEIEYLNSIKETYFLTNREYGIDVIFLVYSDVSSSQKIFEDLMFLIDGKVSEIRRILSEI